MLPRSNTLFNGFMIFVFFLYNYDIVFLDLPLSKQQRPLRHGLIC